LDFYIYDFQHHFVLVVVSLQHTHRQPDWLQLTGLLHDLGKIMFLWGNAEDGQDGTSANGPQWSLGGDTWVVGCRIPNAVIYPHLNLLNPDAADDRYNSKYGMYQPHCGLNALCLAWGHDEYLYRMLIANQETCTLPPEALDMIRYHSAYPLHSGGNAYTHLLQLPNDEERLEWVRLFNQFDLYTKDNAVTFSPQEIDEIIWPYYHGLLEKYGLAGPLKW
jgi:inositol oxygenase